MRPPAWAKTLTSLPGSATPDSRTVRLKTVLRDRVVVILEEA